MDSYDKGEHMNRNQPCTTAPRTVTVEDDTSERGKEW